MAGLYDYRWQRFRVAWLTEHPYCRMCEEQGRVTVATVVDHIEPHGGDPELFWREGNHQSLCASCHNSEKQRLEKGGTPKRPIGLDGWPIEPSTSAKG